MLSDAVEMERRDCAFGRFPRAHTTHPLQSLVRKPWQSRFGAAGRGCLRRTIPCPGLCLRTGHVYWTMPEAMSTGPCLRPCLLDHA